jgi:isocitrate dehydrogenase (NAD+)
MVQEGRAQYADPCAVLRASVLLLEHIGKPQQAALLTRALDTCMYEERKLTITGRDTGCTSAQFADYLTETIQDMESRGKS